MTEAALEPAPAAALPGARRHTGRATALVAFSACCFGSIPIIITVATRDGARLIDLLSWRFLVASALLTVVSGGLAPLRRVGSRALPLLLFAGAGQAAVNLVSLSALRYIPAATLTFLFYSYPAWVAVISAVRGTDPLTARRAGALALSLAGLALMVGIPGAGGLHPLGVLLALASALLYALYIPMIDHLGTGLAPSVTAAYASVGAAAVLATIAIATGGLALHFAPTGWMAVALLSVLCTVLAFLAFLRGLSTIGPVRTAIVSTVEPFWAALLGSVVLGQRLGVRTLAGGLLIATAVVLLQLGPHGAAPASAAAPPA
jgi:drug/metabolite transporter (DMT)-like permease